MGIGISQMENHGAQKVVLSYVSGQIAPDKPLDSMALTFNI